MTIDLNDTAIYDEILALTALRAAIAPPSCEGQTPFVTRDQLPGLRNMVRMMFAETVISLGHLAVSCTLDDADPAPALPYSTEGDRAARLTVELRCTADTGKALAIKRTLEHIVAAKVLDTLSTGSDAEFALTMRTQHQSALDALTTDLCEDRELPPARVQPRWW